MISSMYLNNPLGKLFLLNRLWKKGSFNDYLPSTLTANFVPRTPMEADGVTN